MSAATQGLTREMMIQHFAQGCKPREQWKIGTEHEKIGFCIDTLRPIPYTGKRSIRRILELRSEQGWEQVLEDGKLIALRSGPASITLEPGGQLELSGAPLSSIHETCFETTQHLRLLKEITDKLGIGFLALGFQPKWRREDIDWMPKARYAVMRRYMPEVGNKGLDMMLRTATVQSNLDFASERDMARKMRIAVCLQPLVTALYAASPFVEGQPTGLLSNRAAVWMDTDPDRTGIPACVFDEHFGFESWVDYLLDVPMYFVQREGLYVDCAGASFRDFLEGKLPQLPGELPRLEDWDLHASTVFPEVRLKQFIEMRGADAGSWSWICGLSALWKGLLYEPQAEQHAWEMIADWQFEEVCNLRMQVPKSAFRTPFRDTQVLDLCKQMLSIAKDGLRRLDIRDCQGDDETKYLKPLTEAVEAGQTQAERWLCAYENEWGGDIDKLFWQAMHQ